VSADCAITAVDEVAKAQALGMEVIVTDHHALRGDGRLPPAPIVHPVVCDYPCRELCATAVAHKLAQRLWQAAAESELASAAAAGSYRVQDDLDLVALATIADVVPLLGENRTLVQKGLRALAATTKPGLRALMSAAGVRQNKVDERAVGFGLAPRLNAVGRLYRADAGLELLLTEDHARAGQIAAELDRANRERRHVETRILFEAQEQVAAQGERYSYVLAAEGWHPGVIGIVASRLTTRHHRPAVMISLDDQSGRGSGRSIEGFDLLAGLRACERYLGRYGGHRAAAGLELERDRLQAFRDAFEEHARATLSADLLARRERVDAVVQGRELTMPLAEELQLLAPFGCANPAVSLLVRAANLTERRAIGEGRHVSFKVLAADGALARAVAFGNGGRLAVEEDELADATFTLEVNEWQGVSEPRLVLRHAQTAAVQHAHAERPELAAAEAAAAAGAQAQASPATARPGPSTIPGIQWQLPGIEDQLEQQTSASSM
jgi:single-stranded-DNA-specific exonuclease